MPNQPKNKQKDPVQQRLRDHKHEWSVNTSALISKIIAFKRGLNGRGDAKYNLSPSSIKDPLPGEIGSFLVELSGDFQKVVSDAKAIIAEQGTYSNTRRKKNPNSKPQQQPTNILSRIGSIDTLDKTASNSFTRFWQYITSVLSRKEFEKQRIGLLKQSADLYKGLNDFEDSILSLGIETVPNSIEKYKDFKYNFDALNESFKGIVEAVAKNVKEVPATQETKNELGKQEEQQEKQQETKPSEPEKQEQQKALKNNVIDNIKSDIHLMFNAGISAKSVVNIGTMISDYEKEKDLSAKSLFADRILENYNILMKSIQKKYDTKGSKNIQDIINAIKNKKFAEDDCELLYKNAHNSVSRFLKRQLIKAVPYNKTAPIRLDIVKIIGDMKIAVNGLMDLLESGIAPEEIAKSLKEISVFLESVKRPLHILNIFYSKYFFDKQNIKKDKNSDNPFFDNVMNRRIRRDLLEDLT